MLSRQAIAQISVTNNNTASVLAQKLVGPGVYISNPSIQCNANQSGLFTVTSSNLGVDSGILLTTGIGATVGLVNGVNGPQVNFASANQGSAGDADLTALAGIATYDRCVLEFDLKADGDSIIFKYIFGSEEYPAFNCTNYNDVFGFYISGPGYPSPQNIALIPGTAIPVAINSVNSGVISPGGSLSNCTAMGAGSPFTSYYVNNTGGTTVTYDGFTQLFTAKAGIQKCSTYHLKLAIADGFDHIFDSGVFLQAGSLRSNSVSLSALTDSMTAGIPTLFEGCDSAIVKIHRHLVQTTATTDTVNLLISGTATNGADFPAITTNYVFSNSLADTLRTIYIDPFNDLVTEGTETLKIVLLDKCNTHVDSITIQIKDPPKFTLYNNDTSICFGQTVTANGIYDNGLNFSWSPTAGVSNPTSFYASFSPTVTTTYVLTATYGNCDPIKDSFKVIVNPLPTLGVTYTNILCNGANNGSLVATGTVNIAPLSISIIPSPSTQFVSPATFNNLSAGSYTVTISSGFGCTKTTIANITEPPPLTWANATSVNIGCNSVNTGQIVCNTSGGNGAISYTLSPGNVTNSTGSFSALGPGSYVVTAKDANNCSVTSAFTISQASGLALASVTSSNILCNGLNTGALQILASGGTGTISYTLNPGNVTNTTGNFTTLVAGTYTVQATDANGCSGSTIATITQPSALSFSSITPTNILCNGASTGSVTAISIGGTPSITYTINPGAVSNVTGVFTGLAAGTYTVSMVDGNGCTKTIQTQITQPNPIIVSNVVKVNPTCVPGNNGSITVTASGGSAPLTYKLNSGAYQSSNAFSSLSVGAYIITIKDANGCTVTTTANLNYPNSPSLVSTTMPIPCTTNLGTINVTVNNGTSPFTFTLMPGNVSNSTGVFPNAVFGTAYTITVVDANGCTASIVVSLAYPPIMSWSSFSKTDIPCTGVGTGSITAMTTGGTPPVTYKLLPNNTTNSTGVFNNLTTGAYTIVVTDATGCTLTNNCSIIVSPTYTLAPNVTNISCNGQSNGSVSVVATGGTGTKTFTLTPGGSTNTSGNFTNLGVGTYTVSVIDGSSCTNSTTFSITMPTILSISNVSKIYPSCANLSNGSLTINAAGGTTPYSYSVNGSPFQALANFTSLSNLVYSVVVKDANGCSVSSTVSLINPNNLSFASVVVNQASCSGGGTGSITVNTTGGTGTINYVVNPLGISNTNGLFTNMPVNNYTITVTDGGGCTITSIASIVQPSQIVWDTTYFSSITCNGLNDGQIHAHALGGNGALTYLLTPGAVSNSTGDYLLLSANTYTVKATDANGCTLTSSFVIVNPAPLIWNSPTKTNVICNGTATGTITAISLGGTSTVTYTLNPGAVVNTTGLFTSLMSNTYTVTASDVNGCSISTSLTITQAPPFNFTSVSNTIPTCIPGNNATITANVSGGLTPYLFSLNGGAPQSSNVFNGIGVSTYTIQVTDGATCSITSIINVSNPVSPSITAINQVNILCFGNNTGSIQTTASGGTGSLSYTLNPGSITNLNGTYNSLFANNYTVSVTDANGCSATSNILISQPPLLYWDSVNHRDISCYGGSNGIVASSASGGAGVLQYTLYPGGLTNLSGAFFGLAVGQYTINAADSNGCLVTATFYINQAPPIIWNSLTSNPASCYGGTNGSLSITASGGVGGFSYKIMPGAITNTTGSFSNLNAGTYTITTTDANSCTATTTALVGQAAQVILVNTATTFASCAPGCDGTATFTAAGGNGVYTYSPNGGGSYQASNTFSGLCTSVYTVMIKDGNNCTGSGTYSISTANGPNQISANITNVACQGAANGSATISASGGTGTMNYKLMPGNFNNTTGIFGSLSIGNYTITATDATGCTISTMILITQPNSLLLNQPTISQPSCYAGTNGSFTITTSGGTGAINYLIQPSGVSNSTGIFTNLSATNYTVTSTDANNCTVTSLVVIGQPTQLICAVSGLTQVSCFGGNDGAIQASSTGGTGSTNFVLMPGNISNTTGTFTGLIAGNYTITVTDANNCTNSKTQTITQPTVLNITQISSTIPTCVPGADASLTITAAGGTAPYTFQINAGAFQTANIFTGLSAGAYTVVVKDAKLCTTTSIWNIINPASPIINSIAMLEASCNPGCDGKITISSSNGIGAHTYSINGGAFQTSTTFNNLCANTYTVIAKDASGCTVSSITAVTTIAGPVLTNVSNTHVLCNGGANGTILLTVSGGTGLITYGLQPGNQTSTIASWTGLSANSYTITGTDTKGCTISTVSIITQPNALSFGIITSTPPLCFNGDNGQIVAPVVGGTPPYNYSISPAGLFTSPNIFNNLFGNITYTITVVDANACSTTTSLFLAQPLQVNITNISTTPVTCYGLNNGSLSSTANGGTGLLSYHLMPGNITNNSGNFVGLPGNIYTVTVTDANGCSKTSTSLLFEPSPIVINSAIATDIICYGQINGTINVVASGGTPSLSYQLQPLGLSNGTGSFNTLSANIYTVVVTDGNGCTKTVSKTIIEPTLVHFDSVVPTNVLCAGQSNGAIQSIASGGVGSMTYTLNPGNVVNSTGLFTGLPINTYTIQVVDANNCAATTTMTLFEPTPINLTLDSVKNITCHGGNDGYIGTSTTGGLLPYLYTLMPNAINSSIGNYPNLFAGNYTMFVTDLNGCKDSINNIGLIEPPVLVYTLVNHQDITCYLDSSGSITVAVVGGNGSIGYSILPSGIGNQNTSGYFTGLIGGTYTVTATDSKGCTVTTTVEVLQNLQIDMDVDFIEPICHGDANGSILIHAIGGTAPLSFSLDNGALTQNNLFQNLTAGTHTIVTVDAKQCVTDTTVILTEPEKVGALVNIENTKCNTLNDGQINAIGTGGRSDYTYYLKPGLYINKTGIFYDLKINNYTLTVKDSAGCTFDTLVVVAPPEDPLMMAITSKNIGCFGNGTEGWAEANPEGGKPPYTYLWNLTPASIDKRIDNLRFGYYAVEVTDAQGCTISDSVYIEPGPCCEEIFIPNAFSPNNDGKNDIWRVTTAAGIELIQLEVYDRWGNRVWGTTDPLQGWDGNFKGKKMDMETYFYILRYLCLADGQKHMKKGDVIIVK